MDRRPTEWSPGDDYDLPGARGRPVEPRASVPQTTARTLSTTLAVAAGIGFLLTLAVAIYADWVVPVAVCASLLGLLLKALFFNPWLLLGVLIDLGVLLGVAHWPWH
jgi:hypothetical protein